MICFSHNWLLPFFFFTLFSLDIKCAHVPLLLLLSCFSRVWLCVTLWTAAHQAPPSLGFSRQEYWSGLPFPSPMHACMLSRFSHVQLCATLWTAAHQAPLSTGFSRQEYWSGLPFPSNVPQLYPTLWGPMDCSLPGSSVHGIFQARILEWVAIFSSKGSSQPRDQNLVSWIADGFFTTEPLRNPLDISNIFVKW